MTRLATLAACLAAGAGRRLVAGRAALARRPHRRDGRGEGAARALPVRTASLLLGGLPREGDPPRLAPRARLRRRGAARAGPRRREGDAPQLRHDLGARRGQEPAGARPRQRARRSTSSSRPPRQGACRSCSAPTTTASPSATSCPSSRVSAPSAWPRSARSSASRGTTRPGPRPYGSFTTSPGGGVRQDHARRHHARVDRGPAPARAGAGRTPSSRSPSPTCATGRGCTSRATAPRRTRSSRRSRRGRTTRAWRSVAKTPHASPWRVLMIADHPGRLVESNLVANLATPLQLKDTSWITPGRSAWDRWWSGDWAPGADFKVAMNTATMKYFTDLAAEMGWEYVLVDWGWYGPITDFETGGERDCTKPVAAVDVPEIVRYAKAKNVKVAGLGLLDAPRPEARRGAGALREVGRRRHQGRFHGPRRPVDGQLVRDRRAEGGRAPPHRRLPRGHEAHRPRARLPEPPHARRRPRQRVQQVERPRDPGAQGHAALHAHARGADGLHARRLPPRHEGRASRPRTPSPW